MGSVGQYVISIMAAALICAIAMKLLEGKGAAGQVGKILCGIFLLFSVLKPLSAVRIYDNDWGISGLYQEAENVVSQGEDSSRDCLEEIIKNQLEAYILDKASQYNARLRVEVLLSKENIPTPVSVTLLGTASPYAKKQLETMLQEDLGIKKEDQKWILQ